MLALVMLFWGYILSSDLFPVFTWFALELRSEVPETLRNAERQMQFETLCADAYLNPELNQIMIKAPGSLDRDLTGMGKNDCTRCFRSA